MGRFDGILLCSDLDDTLLTSDKKISQENKKALEMFMSNGGKFAFATGRVPLGARLALEYIVPNAPIICFNGAGIYDFNDNKLLWEKSLDKDAYKVVEYVEQNMPESGIEVCTNDKVYFCRTNRIVRIHKQIEKFPDNDSDYRSIQEDWKKVIFMQEHEEMPKIKKLIAESGYSDSYSFIQSSPNYYELLPKGATKGDALRELARILGIDESRTIGVGDNENDFTLVRYAGIGVAVSNAVSMVRDAADYITVDNNHSALCAIIEGLDKGRISFDKKGSEI